MKQLFFFFNSIASLSLLVLLVLSYIQPSTIPFARSITLLTPVLIVVNALFFVWWFLRFSKNCLLSLITLIICSSFVSSFFQFNFQKNSEEQISATKLKILDFNAYGFCRIETNTNFKKDFIELVKKEKPDIFFFQEVNISSFDDEIFKSYKYRETTVTKGVRSGANPILSKFPIVNYGSVGMDNVHIGRNTLFADIKIGQDTIRCYNSHLTSYRLAKEADKLKEKGAKTLISRLDKVFKHQEKQVNVVTEHMKKSPYPIIYCGDFNNMAFSYVYRAIKDAGNLKDSFLEKGSGFGATHNFQYFPTRIDFILVAEEFVVNSHKVIKTKNWSDHYPIITTLSL